MATRTASRLLASPRHTRDRQSPTAKESGDNLRAGISKWVPRRLSLPTTLQDWHKAGVDWFEKDFYNLLARMPIDPWVNERTYVGGALKAGQRVIQNTGGTGVRVSIVRQKSFPASLTGGVPLSRDELGLVTFQVEVPLWRPSHEIFVALAAALARERAFRGIEGAFHRPTEFANFKRDFVIFVLDREGWDLPSIECQLEEMGCRPIRSNDAKQYLRKIRVRFERLGKEIIAGTVNATKRLHAYRGLKGGKRLPSKIAEQLGTIVFRP